MKATIWHHARCSKSRQTLALLEEKGAEITILHYQKDPPSREEIKSAVERLGLSPKELVRTGDKAFKELQLDLSDFGDDQWLDLLADNPALIQRPIVFTDRGAAIGRPPESVLEIL